MIVEKLKKHIDKNDLKKKRVAQLLGISVGHLSYVLNNHREPSVGLENKIRELVK